MKRTFYLLVLACWLSCAGLLCAQVPQLISYQGRVAVAGANYSGSGLFKFALVNGPSGTTTYWSNDGTSVAGGQPTNAVTLTVSNGLYSLLLGDTTLTNMTAVPNSVFSNSDVRLRIWFNDGTNGWQQFTPDQRIASVAYAVIASGVTSGAITSSMIASGAVGSSQLATKAVQTANIADGAVGSTQIANGAIGAAQLAPGVVGSQTFTSSGTFTVPSNVNLVFVTLIGGGGGGGAGDQLIGGDNYGGGGGGGGGFIVNCPVLVTPGSSYTVTVGIGGAGAPSGPLAGTQWFGKDGTAGGTSSFGSLVSANGGGGGGGATGVNEGGGGAGGGGGGTVVPMAAMGYTGNDGNSRGNNGSFVGGAGASSSIGTGGAAASGANANGANATGYGAGGGGGAPTNNNNGKGGNGSPGIVIIRY